MQHGFRRFGFNPPEACDFCRAKGRKHSAKVEELLTQSKEIYSKPASSSADKKHGK